MRSYLSVENALSLLAQGTSLGLWSFLSKTNDNPEETGEENIFKFVDDKTTLEVVNLLSIGIASHNNRSRVPSNIMTGKYIIYINIGSQENLHFTDQEQIRTVVLYFSNFLVSLIPGWHVYC